MTDVGGNRVLYVIVCAAGPAGDVGRLVDLARERGWTVQIIATPSALAFINVPALETLTGRPVRSQYRSPGEPKTPPADAIIVAPATYNTINKWANGTSDTYALGILAEAPGMSIPVVVLGAHLSARDEKAVRSRSCCTVSRTTDGCLRSTCARISSLRSATNVIVATVRDPPSSATENKCDSNDQDRAPRP
jgi:Flavoprotein